MNITYVQIQENEWTQKVSKKFYKIFMGKCCVAFLLRGYFPDLIL